MISVLSGNEPYMIEHQVKQLCGKLQFPELNLLKTDTLDDTVVEFFSVIPMVDSFKIAVVHLKDLKMADVPFLYEMMESDSLDELIIVADEYDGRSKFYKALNKAGVFHSYNKDKIEPSLITFMNKRVAAMGASFESGVCEAMIKRAGYVENDACNIYTLCGYLSSMCAINKQISMELMKSFVPEYHQEEIFGIASMLVKRDISGLRIQSELFKGDEMHILLLLLREYRIAYKSVSGFSNKEIGIFYKPILSTMDKAQLIHGMEILTRTIRGLKLGQVMKSTCLTEVFCKLMGMA